MDNQGASASQTGLSSASPIEPLRVSPVPASIPSADSRLQKAIDAGKAEGKLALYFGCIDRPGHYLHNSSGNTVRDEQQKDAGFPWSLALMDGGLLQNSKRPDIYDGKVFWTAGGMSLWYAFYWWDRSVDHRGASNSGLYVRGFGWPEAQEAFDYACGVFPRVVARQRQPLILQAPLPAQAIEARRAMTGTGIVHESAVGNADAPEPYPTTHKDT